MLRNFVRNHLSVISGAIVCRYKYQFLGAGNEPISGTSFGLVFAPVKNVDVIINARENVKYIKGKIHHI